MACWRSPAAKGPVLGIDVKIDGHEQHQVTGIFHIDTAGAVDVADAIDLAEFLAQSVGHRQVTAFPAGRAWWISRSALIVCATQVYTVRLKLAIMIATLIIIAKLVSKAAVATVQRRNAYTRLSSANSPSTPSQRVRVCRPTRVRAETPAG